MTWDGRNLDVLAALAAIGLVAWSWWVGERKVPVAAWWAFEALGLGMLVNIALTSFPATPGPFYAGEAVPFMMVAFDAPVTWIVPVCVAGAVAGHLVLARALWASDGPAAVRRSRD